MTPDSILHYTIEKKLGEGGMGAVFLATDTRLNRKVAIKFLSPDRARDPESRQRFIHEAKAEAMLSHPNIVTFHEVGEADGRAFIVMEFVEGQSLPDYARSQRLSLTQILDIVIQVGLGLQAAHEKGVIHRDIKPENIMVTPKGHVKLTDFGLARWKGATTITKTGTRMGTAYYMSPEQAEGLKVDRQSDIFSLGVILYELVCGQRPFEGDSEAAILYEIVTGHPAPMARFCRECPEALERAVSKCLDKNPAERYQHVEELAVDLRYIQQQLEPKAVRTHVRHQKSTRWRLGIVFLATVVVVGAGLGAYWYSHQPEPPLDAAHRIRVAVVDVDNQTQEEALNGISGLMITSLQQSRRLWVLPRLRMFSVLGSLGMASIERIDVGVAKDIARVENLSALVVATIRKFGDVYTLDAQVLNPGDNDFLFSVQETAKGEENIPSLIDRLGEGLRSRFGELEQDIGRSNRRVADITTDNMEAYRHFFRGEELMGKFRFDEAEGEFEQAIQIDSTFALAYYRLADCSRWVDDPFTNRAQIAKTLTFADRLPEREATLVRGFEAASRFGYDSALSIVEPLIALNPEDRDVLFVVGDFAFHSDKTDVAMNYFREALAIDSSYAPAIDHLIRSYERKGEWETAQELAQRWLDVDASERAYYTVAMTDARLAKFTDGIDVLTKATLRYPGAVGLREDLADMYLFSGDFKSAALEFSRMRDKDQPANVRYIGYWRLPMVYSYVGQYRRALAEFDSGIQYMLVTGDTARAMLMQVLKGQYYAIGWGDRESAWREAQKTLKWRRRKDWVGYWGNLAMLGHYIGRNHLAESLAISAEIAYEPDNDATQSIMYGYAGNCELADSLREAAFDLQAGSIQILMLYASALCHFEAGDYNEAQGLLERLQSTYFGRFGRWAMYYPKSFYLLGRIAEAKGDVAAAVDNYERFLDLWKDADPGLEGLDDARTRLADLKS